MLLLFLTLDEMNTTISVVNFFATAMFLFFPRWAIFKGKLQLIFGAMVLNCSRDLRPLYSLFCSLLCGAFWCFLSACKPKHFSDFVLFGAFQRLHFPSPCKNGYYVHYYVVLFGAFSRLDITTLKRLLSPCFSKTSFPITLNGYHCSLLCCAF